LKSELNRIGETDKQGTDTSKPERQTQFFQYVEWSALALMLMEVNLLATGVTDLDHTNAQTAGRRPGVSLAARAEDAMCFPTAPLGRPTR